MRATTIHAPGDIRVSEVARPDDRAPTDAIVKVTAGCICGSDLWPYRGENDITPGRPIGHECIGVVEEVGSEVTSFRPGDFVIVPFCHCDNTCPHCRAGVQSACVNLGFTTSGQGGVRPGHPGRGQPRRRPTAMPDAGAAPVAADPLRRDADRLARRRLGRRAPGRHGRRGRRRRGRAVRRAGRAR